MELKEFRFTLKNMVSISCIKLIELYFDTVKDVRIKRIFIGGIVLHVNKETISQVSLINHFEKIGCPVVFDEDTIITERIKAAAIELILLSSNNDSIIRNSDYISDKLQLPYDKISKVFSKVTGTTLERYIILLKIEKAKQMVLEDKLTLSEISYQLGYSSVQYLSRQFKQITGLTFSEFKSLEEPPRVLIENII